jgi:hypothetical protein
MRTEQKRRSKNLKTNRLKGIEKYSSIIFKIIGVLFLILALYYTFDVESNGTISKISKLITTRSREVTDSSKTVFSWEIFKNLLLVYIPGILGGLICIWFSQKKPKLSYYGSIITLFLITFFNCKIFLENWIESWRFCYSNYIYASSFLIIPICIFLYQYWRIQKPVLLTFISLYFYTFIFQLLIIRFSYTYIYILTAVLVYSLIMYLITRKNNYNRNTIENQFISLGFIIIFIVRQLYVNHKLQSINLFFIFSFCYFLIFYIITLLLYFKKSKYLYLILNWINTLIYISICYYSLYIFRLTDNIIYPIFTLLAIHICSLFLLNKYSTYKNKTFSIDVSSIILISIALSLLWKDYKFELFFGSLSVLSIYYAKLSKNKFFIWLSLSITLILVTKLIYLALKLCFSILELELINTTKLITFGFINCGIVLISVLGVKKLVGNIKDSISNDWFNRSKFIKFLNIFLLLNVFIFIEWTLISLIFTISGNLDYVKKSFIIIASLFAYYIISHPEIVAAKFKNTVFHTIFFYSLATPIIRLLEFPYFYKNDLSIHQFLTIESLFHYTELIISFIILFKSLKSLRELNKNRTYLQHFFEVLLGIIIIISLCIEYDYFIITKDCFNLERINIDIINNKLFYNQVLPYSLIILISSICILILGVINNNRFLRVFSILIILFDLVKIFIIEFEILSQIERTNLLFITGLIFLLISWMYNKIRHKKRNRNNVTKNI